MKLNFASLWPMLFIGMGFLLLVVGGLGGGGWGDGLFGPTPTATPEQIVPTRTPVGTAASALVTPPPVFEAAVPTPPAGLPLVVPPAHNPIGAITAAQRWGATFPEGAYAQTVAELGLGFGSYLNWHADLETEGTEAMYWRMVRVGEEGLANDTWESLTELAQTNPGSFWLVGNEMDVKWQDNVTAEQYAAIYHEVYTHLKAADPTAYVGIGGISQPTPLRMAYLDSILLSYSTSHGTPLPTDFWNVHAFILPEEEDSWGVDIPPGMSAVRGEQYGLDEHDNLAIFAQNIIAFREWMAARGYRERPLVVTEYGILMPPDYGFEPERVAQFLAGTLDFFTTAADPTLGYPADDNKLVQWWFWYAVYDTADRYPAGNLYNPTTGQLTQVGEVWARYERE